MPALIDCRRRWINGELLRRVASDTPWQENIIFLRSLHLEAENGRNGWQSSRSKNASGWALNRTREIIFPRSIFVPVQGHLYVKLLHLYVYSCTLQTQTSARAHDTFTRNSTQADACKLEKTLGKKPRGDSRVINQTFNYEDAGGRKKADKKVITSCFAGPQSKWLLTTCW